MRFIDIAKTRYSCRDYKPDHVDEKELALVLEAARVAPSAINYQPTCWICNFNLPLLKQICDLPEHIEPIAMIPLGYPNDQSNIQRHETKRKSKNEIIHWEKF